MAEPIDFLQLWKRFDKLDPGPRAEIKRVRNLDELDERPAFYRLFPGRALSEGIRRVAFCLPWVEHSEGVRLGAQLAKAGVGEQRLFQVMRSTSPNDLIQMRRLLQHAQPTADWRHLGLLLMHWRREDKRRVLEDFYLTGSHIDSGEVAD